MQKVIKTWMDFPYFALRTEMLIQYRQYAYQALTSLLPAIFLHHISYLFIRTNCPCEMSLNLAIPKKHAAHLYKWQSWTPKLAGYITHSVYPKCNSRQAIYSVQLHIKQSDCAAMCKITKKALSGVHSCLHMSSPLMGKYNMLGIFLATALNCFNLLSAW